MLDSFANDGYSHCDGDLEGRRIAAIGDGWEEDQIYLDLTD